MTLSNTRCDVCGELLPSGENAQWAEPVDGELYLMRHWLAHVACIPADGVRPTFREGSGITVSRFARPERP